jgi:hypothetical protein
MCIDFYSVQKGVFTSEIENKNCDGYRVMNLLYQSTLS